MAREGSEGVDASLNISRRPLASKTKSVNVPPVSTPTRTLRTAAFFVLALEEKEIFHLSFDIFHLSLMPTARQTVIRAYAKEFLKFIFPCTFKKDFLA